MSGQIGKKELSEEESLCELFRKCDGSYNTGQVRAQDLLSALKNLLDKDVVFDQTSLDALSRLIDPRNDNVYLEVHDFVKLGKEWIRSIRKSPNDTFDMKILETSSKSDLKSKPLTTVFRNRFGLLNQSLGGQDESLGILPEEYTSSTCHQSLSEVVGDVNLKKIADLELENEELLKHIARLQREKADRDQEFLRAEDEIEDYKSTIRMLEKQIKKKEIFPAIEECRETSTCSANKSLEYIYDDDVSEKKTESLSLSFENSRLRSQLEDYHALLQETKDLNQTIAMLRKELANKELELSEVCQAKEMLSFQFNELRIQSSKLNESTKLEVQSTCNDFSNSFNDEMSSIDADLVFDTTLDMHGLTKDIMKQFGCVKDQGRFTFSTPGLRGSIGDELKNVGTKGPPLLEISEIETGFPVEATHTHLQLTTQCEGKIMQIVKNSESFEEKDPKKTVLVLAFTLMVFLSSFILMNHEIIIINRDHHIPCLDFVPATVCSIEYSLKVW